MPDQSPKSLRSCPRNQLPGRFAPARATNSPGRSSCRATNSPGRFAPARRTLLPSLTWHNVGTEVLAGITLLAIALPLNIGYAQIAGLPTAGLYAPVLPSVVFALLASSRRHLVVARTRPPPRWWVRPLRCGGRRHGTVRAAMAAARTIVGGLLFTTCAVFRLGFLADFLSKPILIGFVGGLATDILLRSPR